MAGEFSQETRLIQWAAGDISKDVFIHRMHYEETLGRMFECELELQTRNPDITAKDILLQTVGIALRRGDGKIRRINGTIVAVKQVGVPSKERLNEFRAIVAPWMWFMTRRSDCRIFQKMDVKQILKTVLEGSAVGEIEEIYSGQYKEKDFVVQYKETMFNFYSRIMEEEGIYSFIRHLDDGGQKVVVCDDSLRAETIEGYETVFLAGDTSNDGANEESFTTWQGESRVEPAKYALRAFDYMTNKVVDGEYPMGSGGGGDDEDSWWEIFEYPGPYEKTDEADHYAQVRQEELKSRGELYIATGDVRGLQPGFKFTLAGSPRAADNREWLVVSYRFTADNGPMEGSGGGDSEDFECQVAMIPADKPFRLARATEKPLITGPQTAIVVGPESEEIYTDDEDELARVKVRFHWDRHAKDENCSCWVRVSQPWAGKGYGGMFLPRKGQEVIIEFLDGDPDKPIITGRVYNGVNKPLLGRGAFKTSNGFISNTTKGGEGFNAITMSDTKGEEVVLVAAQKFLRLHAKGNSEMRWDENYHEWCKKNYNTKISGAHSLGVSGNQTLSVGGDVHQNIHGDAYIKAKGTYSTAGKMVYVQGKEILSLICDSFLTLWAKADVQISSQEKIDIWGAEMYLSGDEKVHIKSKEIVLEADMTISLKVGGNFIVISSSGVDINGTQLKLNMGGAAKVAKAAEKLAKEALEEPDKYQAIEMFKPGQGGESETDSHESKEADTRQSPAAEALSNAAEEGTPFCAECEAARQENNEIDEEDQRLREEEEQACREEEHANATSGAQN